MKTVLRILIVEDSEDDALLVLHQIKKAGYKVQYERVQTTETMKNALKEKTWDIILCDYKMPHFDGLEALTVLRESGIDIPLIVISGTIGEEVAVKAMIAGAQDYIMKNDLQRLIPAIERELRESESRTERRRLEQKQKQAEKERLANLHFFESMNKVNRAIQGASDVDSMMNDVLNVVLPIFDCDRTWLFYPCDPAAPSFRVPMEITKPEYPGARMLNVDVPMPPDMAQNLREILESAGPVTYTVGTANPINKLTAEQFGVQSQMMVALFPKTGKPWAFGLHQCSCPRIWTKEEKRLFLEVGRRLTDGLTSLLMLRNLRLSEAENRAIVKAVPDLLFRVRKDGSIADFQKPEDIELYIPPDRFLGKTVNDVLPPDVSESARAAIERALNKKEVATFEYDLTMNDQRRFYECRVTAISSDEVLAVVRDITERKQAETALKLASLYARNLIEASIDPLVTISPEGKITDVNQATETVTGVSRRTLIGSDFSEYFTQPEKARIGYHQVLSEGLVKDYPLTIRHTSGKTTDVLYNATVYKNEAGDVQGVFAAARDITEQKRAVEKVNHLAAIVQSSDDAIIGKDLDGIITSWNKGAENIYGYAESEVVGKPISILLPAESTNELPQILTRVKSGEHIDHYETARRRKDGKEIQMSLTISPIRDAEGNIIAASTIGRDITERKRAEKEIKMLSVAVEQSTEGIAIANLDGNLIFINDAWVRMHGYKSSGELLGSNLAIFHNQEQMQNEVKPFNKKAIEFGACSGEIGHITKDGKAFPTLMTTTLLRDKKGKPYAIAGIAMDITERKEAEGELRRLTHAIEQSPVSVVITNTSGEIEYVNPKFTEITGYTKDEIIRKNPRILKSGETALEEYKQLWETISAGKEWRGEFHNKKKNGELFWEAASISPVRDEKGTIKSFVAIKEDITERKRAEEELKHNQIKRHELEVELVQAQKLESLGTLASGIAHDFNNILGIILGHSGLLDPALSDPARVSQSRDAIQRATMRGASLVRQLLTFARKSESIFVSVSVNNIINEVIDLLRETLPKTITVSTELKTNLPTIIADATQIHQVFLNLCVNARDAMPKGGNLCITTTTVSNETVTLKFPKAAAREYVLVKVTDTGSGMDDATKQRIFDPFFTTKGPGKGTGLGLALVHSIVESHNGMIVVESILGKGTRFKLYFPAEERTIEDFHPPVDRLIDVAGGTETILVIDDEEPLTEMLQKILTSKGYNVLTAFDGEEGVSLFTRHQKEIAVVLSDLGLPKFGGEEVAKRVKAIDAKTRVIIASGFIDPEVKAEMQKIGVTHFIQKPYSLVEVTQNVRTVIDTET
jgi:PAS domain S-box-containing protein